MRRFAVPLAIALFTGLCVLSPEADAGGLSMKDGRWRIEIQGMVGTNIGKGDHSDDVYSVLEIEYEMPFAQRWAFGIKAIPAFVMDQNSPQDGDSTIFGAGLGAGFRVYQHKESRHGLFFEAGTVVLLHNPKFEDNGGSVNFFNEFGLGYKWRSDWHVTAKWEHISNASTHDENAGVNAWGVAIGRTF